MNNVLIVLLVLVVGLVAFIATRPGQFHVERSTTVAAAPEAVFAQVEDLHRWAAWSPWEKLDPQMKKDFSGAPAGVGSVYHWVGNDKVGEGRMTITETQPGRRLRILLEFIKPFASTNTSTFTFAPEGSGTRVTWAMDGSASFMVKAMGILMPMDRTVGPDFERGLASLKGLAESAPPPAPADSSAAAAPAKSAG